MTKIGSEVFNGCSDLKTALVPEGQKYPPDIFPFVVKFIPNKCDKLFHFVSQMSMPSNESSLWISLVCADCSSEYVRKETKPKLALA